MLLCWWTYLIFILLSPYSKNRTGGFLKIEAVIASETFQSHFRTFSAVLGRPYRSCFENMRKNSGPLPVSFREGLVHRFSVGGSVNRAKYGSHWKLPKLQEKQKPWQLISLASNRRKAWQKWRQSSKDWFLIGQVDTSWHDSPCGKKAIESSLCDSGEDLFQTVRRFSTRLTWVHVVSRELQQFLKTRTSRASDDTQDY